MVRGTRAEAEAMWGQILDRAERLPANFEGGRCDAVTESKQVLA